MTLPKTILVPTDFGDASEAAIDYALELGKAVGAGVVLLHSFEVPAVGFPDAALVANADMTNRILEGARIGLDRQANQFEGRGVALRTVIKQGEAWRTIIATAEELGADLIVMGTHGRRGLPRALLGSVAEKVVRTSPVPVLTIHGGEQAARESLVDTGERTARSTTSGPTSDGIPVSRH